MDLIEIIVGMLCIIVLVILLWKMVYSTYRKALVITSSKISKEIQGNGVMIPIPSLKDLVELVKYLKTQKDELKNKRKELEEDNKYSNIYG